MAPFLSDCLDGVMHKAIVTSELQAAPSKNYKQLLLPAAAAASERRFRIFLVIMYDELVFPRKRVALFHYPSRQAASSCLCQQYRLPPRRAPPHVHEIERFQSTPFFHEKIRFITTDDRLPEIEEEQLMIKLTMNIFVVLCDYANQVQTEFNRIGQDLIGLERKLEKLNN